MATADFSTSLYQSVWQRHKYSLLLVIPFILLFWLQLAHHQMWRDELNAWGIATASPDLLTLRHYIHYEAHPSVWYLLLWGASRISASPVAMKCVQAVIGALLYLVIACRTPFSLLEKFLLFCNYYISFEYTVVSRMYGLCLLLAFTFVHRRITSPDKVFGNAVLLGVLVNTDTMGILLSGPLFLEYCLDRFHHWRTEKKFMLRQVGLASLLYLTALYISVHTLKPAPDLSWRTTGHMFEQAKSWPHFWQTTYLWLVVPWWPLGRNFAHYWSPWTESLSYVWLVPIVLGIYYFLFRSHRRILLVVSLYLAGVLAFGHLIYLGSVRHWGFTVILVLLALCLQRYSQKQLPFLAYLLLGLTAGAGAAVAALQWRHPFSNAEPTAQWLRDHHLDKAVLVGTPDTSVASIAEVLNRPMYFLDCSCSDSFLLFSNRRDQFSWEQIPQRLQVAAHELHAPEMILMVSFDGLKPEDLAAITRNGQQVIPMAQIKGADIWGEDFYLYRIRTLL